MSPAAWRTVFLVVVGLFVLWLAYLARAVVTPLLVALLLAYILDPVVRFLQRRGLSRPVASAGVVFVALALLVTVTVVAVSRFASEASGLYEDVAGEPSVVGVPRDVAVQRLVPGDLDEPSRTRLLQSLRETTWQGRVTYYLDADDDGMFDPGYAARSMLKIRREIAGTRWEKPLDKGFDSLSQFGPGIAQSANSFLMGLVAGGRAVISTSLGIFTLLFLFPIYLYYSLVNLAGVYDVAVKHVPLGQRPRVVDILGKIHATLSAFFRGRLITMFVKGVLLLILFVAFGVPFSYVCAVFAALASLVPVLGGIVAAIPPVMLSVHDSTGVELTGLVLGILVIEGLETYVLIPALVGRHVGLHPLTVLVCALVAGELLGLFGMIVAIPLTAVAKILAAEFVLPEIRRRAGLPPRSGAPPPDGSIPDGSIPDGSPPNEPGVPGAPVG